MLDLTPGAIMAEVRQCEKDRDQKLSLVEKAISAYVGASHGDTSTVSDWPVNHPYEYMQLIMPRLVHDNPKVKCLAREAAKAGEAAALEAGMNSWIYQKCLRKTLLDVAVDFSFCFGAMLVTSEARPGYAGDYEAQDGFTPHTPCVYRLSPRQVFFDHRALGSVESGGVALNGYRYTAPRQAVLARAQRELMEDPASGWDLEAITSAPTSQGTYLFRRNSDGGPDRDTVTVYCVWLPQDAPNSPGREHGFNGTWVTIIGSDNGVDGKMIRQPVPAYGPKWGTITIFGAYPVPDSPYPVSPIGGVWEAMVRANAHEKAVNEGLANYKRITVIQKGLAPTAQKAKNGDIIEHAGFDKNRDVADLETGGVTEQNIVGADRNRAALDRVTGVSEAHRGIVQGEATATEVAVADAAGNARIAFLKRQFQDATSEMLRTVGWFMVNDERTAFPLGQKYAEDNQMQDPYFIGGNQGGAVVDDLYDIEIEAYSMERVSDAMQQKQAETVVNAATTIAPLIPTMPWVNWQWVLDTYGNTINMPNLGQNMLMGGPQGAAMLGMMSMMGGGAAQPGMGGGSMNAPALPGEQLAQALPIGGAR